MKRRDTAACAASYFLVLLLMIYAVFGPVVAHYLQARP